MLSTERIQEIRNQGVQSLSPMDFVALCQQASELPAALEKLELLQDGLDETDLTTE